MLAKAVRELRQEDHEFWASLLYGDKWSCHKTEESIQSQTTSICCFYIPNPSEAITVMNLGMIFYTEKLLKSSLFIDSWIFQTKEALMAPNKKVYPSLEYHINVIIWVEKLLDFSLNNPQFLSHRWSFYNLFLSFTLLLTSFENNNYF